MNHALPLAANCDDRHLAVALADGRLLQIPLMRHPLLLAATAEQRSQVELSPLGNALARNRRGHRRREHVPSVESAGREATSDCVN